MEDPVRLDVGQTTLERDHIFEVGFAELDFVPDVRDILHPAPPADDAEDFGPWLPVQDVFGQVAAGETRDPGDQYSHAPSIVPIFFLYNRCRKKIGTRGFDP